MSSTFSHVALVVTALEPQAAFYQGVFGFESSGHVFEGQGRRLSVLMEVDDATIRGLFLRTGSLHLELLEYRSAHHRRTLPLHDDEIGWAHLSFVVDDLDDVEERVVAHGGERRATTRTDFDFGHGAATTMAFCLDPEGNRIELIQHHDRRAREDHAAFLGLSALGWPART